MTEQILKREDGITYVDGSKIFGSKLKGSLMLTSSALSFRAQYGDKEIFSISLGGIQNVRAQILNAGLNTLTISYLSDGKDRKVTVQYSEFWSNAALGPAFKIKEPYFKSWEKLIDETRLGKSAPGITTDLDELEKLGNLKERGLITEDEFVAKKKQILNI